MNVVYVQKTGTQDKRPCPPDNSKLRNSDSKYCRKYFSHKLSVAVHERSHIGE